MNKKIIFGCIALIVLISIFLFLPNQEDIIKSQIQKANYCEETLDCVDAGGKCPFGCYVFVNEAEVERISSLIKSYDSKCVYGCVSNVTVICENNKCVELI